MKRKLERKEFCFFCGSRGSFPQLKKNIYTKRRIKLLLKQNMTGWVYAFETPSMPGFIKIGATRRSPAERLDEANASDTWRPPHPYVITCAVEVADPFAGERAVHALLAARRINPRNEFFDVTADEARTVFSLLTPKAAHDRGRSESLPNLAPLVDSPAAAPVASSASSLLRSWLDANYTRIPLREKDTGTKLEALYSAYTTATPPVHQKILGRNKFAQMMNSVYPGIGPHRNGANTVNGLYLVR